MSFVGPSETELRRCCGPHRSGELLKALKQSGYGALLAFVAAQVAEEACDELILAVCYAFDKLADRANLQCGPVAIARVAPRAACAACAACAAFRPICRTWFDVWDESSPYVRMKQRILPQKQ